MRLIPESANRQDWPRLVKDTVNALVVAVRAIQANPAISLELDGGDAAGSAGDITVDGGGA